MSAPPLPAVLARVAAHLPAGCEAYLVGGAVRDLLLGRPLKDLDLAVPSGGLNLARRLADRLGAAYVPLDGDRGVGRVVWEQDGERLEIDVADFRADGIEADLLARDLTVNALALPLSAPADGERQLVDPAGGERDLESRIVRLISPAALVDDPLRGMRAVRLVAQLGFRLDEQSREWIVEHAPRLADVSAERVRDELWKILVAPQPGRSLRLLDELGLLAIAVPEVVPVHGMEQSAPHWQDVWEHTLNVVERTAVLIALVERLAAGEADAVADGAAAPLPAQLPALLTRFAPGLAERLRRQLAVDRPARGHLLLAALLHDLGKATTRSVSDDGRIHFYGHEVVGSELATERLEALKFATVEVQHVARIVRHHMRPLKLMRESPLPARTLHRFHHAAGDVAPEVCLLSFADNLAKSEQRVRDEWPAFSATLEQLLDAFFFRHEELVRPTPLLRGGELVSEVGVPKGPAVGELMRALAEAQAAGEVADREGAVRFARHWLDTVY